MIASTATDEIASPRAIVRDLTVWHSTVVSLRHSEPAGSVVWWLLQGPVGRLQDGIGAQIQLSVDALLPSPHPFRVQSRLVYVSISPVPVETDSDTPPRMAVAVHEAGHALVALMCNDDAAVSLTPDDPTALGRCATAQRDGLEAAFVLLAGPVAEAIYSDEDLFVLETDVLCYGADQSPEHDYSRALTRIDRYIATYDPKRTREDIVVMLFAALEQFFRWPCVQRAVARIANALVDAADGRLDQSAVRRLAACARWRRDPRKDYWDALRTVSP
ncbi:MAG: hypothetical protein JWN04_109 [Myxococcaceae bacterium]|nr:hypothetical protein [Myxococcaceae bacterium]